MTTHGIVVAAGGGARFGSPKGGVMLGGRPLWERAREALLGGGVDSVVVVGSGGIPGGHRRRDSVAAGLAALPEDAERVLVHDAARPLATGALTRRVLERLAAGGVDGVVPAVPVRDTLKRVEGDWVVETVERSPLVAVQTPQGFMVGSLRAAHASDDEDASDDAVLIERWGGSIAVVPGEEANLKITFPADLAVAEAMLR
ncbi:MAG TPA: 2-C-methyl-D-erythritol 4-phosphate cytidylyltransferase [Acidimicrobiia bacterium]|nr:2-C-methyl-D-erythritol 4-phosphate cytidylyltransferase [Acidimicrobiia bacterium]